MMKMTRFRQSLSFFVCTVLIAAIALFASGCGDNKDTAAPSGVQSTVSGVQSTVSESKPVVKGEGSATFGFTVTDKDGKETVYEIHTDKTTVGEALLEVGLIAGEEGSYGLYVTTVDGITLDYEKDKMYWAFYENGEYASQGVDSTEITEGASYAFKAAS